MFSNNMIQISEYINISINSMKKSMKLINWKKII